MATADAIDRAVQSLRAGKLVAFPTETVYGLGADAENAVAVRGIFLVKGRPADHPLIVHTGKATELEKWAVAIPRSAERLADAFWPGPLTIILRRSVRIPLIVTGGLDTVGIRVPSHPDALALLDAFGGAVAAPSANRFGRVSPTRAEHVRADLGDDVDFVLDGGPCTVGIESTIVDLSSGEPAILRMGGITREQLEAVLNCPVPSRIGGPVRSPGQHDRHYSPHAELVLVREDEVEARLAELAAAGKRVVVLGGSHDGVSSGIARILLPRSTEDVARVLYHSLREVDRLGFDIALVTLPGESGVGEAIADRLRRAAAPR